jgi:sugar phosphate permease
MGFNLLDKIFTKRSPVAFICVICAATISFLLTGLSHFMDPAFFYASMFVYGFFTFSIGNIVFATRSADVGKLVELKTGMRTQTTIIGIIDGTGSFGSATGMQIISFTNDRFGMMYGYWVLISIDVLIAIIPIGHLLINDFK